ncbi:MAG: hypothetical protein JNN05_04555 [Candidatus Omnitrophica bacterium]|nr:hypothetical protein [Candidatus Omnitrophota bacterium]
MLVLMTNVALVLNNPRNALSLIKRAEENIPLHDEVDMKKELSRLRHMANQVLSGKGTVQMS